MPSLNSLPHSLCPHRYRPTPSLIPTPHSPNRVNRPFLCYSTTSAPLNPQISLLQYDAEDAMAVIAQVAGYEESKEEFQRVSEVRVLADLLDVANSGYGGGRWGGEGGVGALRDVPENGSGKWDLGLGWYGSGEWDLGLRWYLVDFGFEEDGMGKKEGKERGLWAP
ncbi:hypothetical protein ACFX2C_019743 [Malus domestica]